VKTPPVDGVELKINFPTQQLVKTYQNSLVLNMSETILPHPSESGTVWASSVKE
jgi:hypothetical protein